MFGMNRDSFGPPSSNDGKYSTVNNLITLADEAFAAGLLSKASHLYLAAFDASELEDANPSSAAVEGLRKAWDIALRLKERALAEHIFEKLEPFFTGEEIAEHTEALQRLALEKLEEFGFSHEDLQDMADMVSEDFAAALQNGASVVQPFPQILSIESGSGPLSKGVIPWPAQTKQDEVPSENTASAEIEASSSEEKSALNPEDYTYNDLIGFETAIQAMHKRGIGLAKDPQFSEFLQVLQRRHGISSLPSFESLLFPSLAREDANQFMLATAKELGAPIIRMYMEETPMGYPVLCVMATSDVKMNPMRAAVSTPSTLVLEDLDLWGAPFSSVPEEAEDSSPYAYLSRGARDAVMFIRSAVENPEITVLATCASAQELDPFFKDLLNPISVVDFDYPNEDERRSIWKDVYATYPSLRPLNSEELVRLSVHMSRFEIYLAAREAVDEAFKLSIENRLYVPVTRDNLYGKIAAYHPLDSEEYLEIEECAVESLRSELSSPDSLLEGIE